MIEKISIVHNNTETDITSYKSLSVTHEVNSETNIMPGCATAAMLRVTIWGESGNIVSTGDMVKYYQSEDDGTTWTLKGLFYAQKPSQITRNLFELIAYDSITKLDVDLTEWLSEESNFSAISDIEDLISAVGTQCGVTINTTGIDNDILSAPVGWLGKISLTGRQIISAIAQIACKFVTADTSGYINFGWYTSGAVGIEPSGDNSTTVSYKQDGLTATDYETETVMGIALINSDTNVKIVYPTGATGNIVSITDNVVLNVISDVTALTDIATVLYNDFTALPNFKPTDIQMFRNNLINVGTYVEVTDGNSNTFYTLITKTELSSSGLYVSSESEENYINFSATALDGSGNATISGNRIISITADKVKTGRVESNDGDTYFDLDNGIIKTKKVSVINGDTIIDTTELSSGAMTVKKYNGDEDDDDRIAYATYGNTGTLIAASSSDDDNPVPQREPGETTLDYLLRVAQWIADRVNNGISGTVTVIGNNSDLTTGSSSVRTSGFYSSNYTNEESSEYRADGAKIDGDLELNGEIGGAYDSGWINLISSDLSASFTFYGSSGYVRYRKIGKIVFVSGIVSPTAEIAGSATTHTIFTLPSGLVPSKVLHFVCQGSTHHKWLLEVNTSGAVLFSRYGDGNGYTAASASTWLPFDVSFAID